MAETDYNAVARRRYPRARQITGNGAYAILSPAGIRLYESWATMNAAKNFSENWIKLSEQKPEPRFNPGIARFRRMVESA